MLTGNRMIENAERQVERETAAGVARITAALSRPGRLVCDCGEEISEARRFALPAARDCIDCATFRERRRA